MNTAIIEHLHGAHGERTLRIMLIEDEPQQREVIGLALSDRGAQVFPCASASEAFARLREGLVPDAILLDLLMPDMNGWQFRLVQRREPTWKLIPVIVVSGDHSPQAATVDAAAYLPTLRVPAPVIVPLAAPGAPR
jgi:CheY-like chemotaxis protein